MPKEWIKCTFDLFPSFENALALEWMEKHGCKIFQVHGRQLGVLSDDPVLLCAL